MQCVVTWYRAEMNILRFGSMQAAKEHITRPLEPSEVEKVDRGMQALDQQYSLQRRLEALHRLPDSSRDSRTVVTNRWRLLTLIPEVGLQVSHANALGWAAFWHGVSYVHASGVGLLWHGQCISRPNGGRPVCSLLPWTDDPESGCMLCTLRSNIF